MTLLDYLATLSPGMPAAELLRDGPAFGMGALERTGTDPAHPLLFHRFAAEDTLVFLDPSLQTVRSLTYRAGFTGEVNGIRIGMHGRDVAARIGRPQRGWPMPHPDIIMLYDQPRFFRVDVDRTTERVIASYR